MFDLKDDSSEQHKKAAHEETNENHKTSTITTTIQTRQHTIHPELLLAFTYFDRNRCGYLTEKDLEEILLLAGLSLTKNEVNLTKKKGGSIDILTKYSFLGQNVS